MATLFSLCLHKIVETYLRRLWINFWLTFEMVNIRISSIQLQFTEFLIWCVRFFDHPVLKLLEGVLKLYIYN